MEITEAKLYEAFGMTPQEPGAQEQESAAPAADVETGNAEEGTQEQPTAGTEQGDADTETGTETESDADSDDPEEGGDQTDDGAGEEKKSLTAEQRRANAARRRAQEQQAATQKAVQEAIQAEQLRSQKQLEEVLAQAGLKNPVTGEQITTLEDFRKWGREAADARLQKDLQTGKLTRETLDQLIAAHPAVQQAQQLQENVRQQQAQQRSADERARIDGQLAKITEINPKIKGLGDILAMDTAPAFRDNVAKGMDFYDAYLLANMDAMAEDKARRAVQAEQDKSRGKEHLRATGNARGSGSVSVPHDQMKLYRMMNPKMTDAQIQAHYNQYLKRGG